MEATMPSYIGALSKNYEVLEKIFEKKYKKFRYLYFLIKKYNSDTVSIDYLETDDNELSISMTVTKSKCKDIVKSLESEVDEDNVSIERKKDLIYIHIINENNEDN